MRKLVSVFAAVVWLALALTACGNNAGQTGTTAQPVPTENGTETESGGDAETEEATSAGRPEEAAAAGDAEQSPEAEGMEQGAGDTEGNAEAGKVLVVYFSATGNTEGIANTIAEYTGADLFELIPVNGYSDEDLDWRAESSRVNQEHDDESLQDIELESTIVENFDSYETIFIGYPIWWQNASWVVNNFIRDNDLTGKTVIPFCTSSSSDFGESGANLAEMAGTGNWLDGRRFSGSTDEAQITEWLDSLDF